ncbi:SepM family pheromone-processing serine protease [Tepidibacillus decaturensis]|uniref:endopeptidase La n=1 Tax=Tepidibacillus decaturensis TaxID=1413211 RepID=A0A135L438_9BACI|nr:SepM family pheromone-processing serine protease [Tepidibacillus decaturensis]KXG43700.1 hypothetical protein U473_06475 [Tepidibacillus decaturensis]
MGKNNNVQSRKIKRIQWVVMVIIIFVYLTFYIPVPYFITSPGSAMELSPMIEVQGGYKEKGNFLLTTVALGTGNLAYYLYTYLDPYMETLPKKAVLGENENPEDYSKRQLQVMKISQEDAMIAAFQAINQPIIVKNKGILVMEVVKGMPAENIFKVGDLIIEVDHQSIKEVKELLHILEKKKAGENIDVRFIREGKTYLKSIQLAKLSQQTSLDLETKSQSERRVGFGIYPAQEREVIPSKKVVFNTEDIGGPSAGLMFTLEIINQLTSEDLTKGYQIAGTGTIQPDGTVGQIGGARLKVKAAYEKGAEIFFVPKDIATDDINQKEAEESNRSLGNPLTIVPVSNVKEALKYLQGLSPKENKK